MQSSNPHCQESAGRVAASWIGGSSDVTSSFGFKNFAFGAFGDRAGQTGSPIRQLLVKKLKICTSRSEDL